MSDRLRAVLLGLGFGLGPLLLLDLARILAEAVAVDGETSPWWPAACYLATGLLAAAGVAAGRRDRLVAGVGAVVLLLVALPTVPSEVAARLPALPVVPTTAAAQAVALVVAAAYAHAALRGGRG